MTLNKLNNFISKLNWRQVVIHAIVFWFFMYAFYTLSHLYNTKYIEIIRYSTEQDAIKTFTDNGTMVDAMIFFSIWTSIAGFVGLLIAFFISLAVSIKRHWFWVNSLIAFIIMYLLYRLNVLGWEYMKGLFWFIGKMFNNVILEFLINGIILLIVGLLFFFSKKPGKFIEHEQPVPVAENS